MTAVTEKYLLGSQTTLMSTELNSSSGPILSSSSYNNSQGQTGDGYTLCDLELFLPAMGIGETNIEGQSISVFFLSTIDNINYEDGSSALVPYNKRADCVFSLRGVNADQKIIQRVWVPQGLFKTLLWNATSQSLASSGNTLKIRPVTKQMV